MLRSCCDIRLCVPTSVSGLGPVLGQPRQQRAARVKLPGPEASGARVPGEDGGNSLDSLDRHGVVKCEAGTVQLTYNTRGSFTFLAFRNIMQMFLLNIKRDTGSSIRTDQN